MQYVSKAALNSKHAFILAKIDKLYDIKTPMFFDLAVFFL